MPYAISGPVLSSAVLCRLKTISTFVFGCGFMAVNSLIYNVILSSACRQGGARSDGQLLDNQAIVYHDGSGIDWCDG